MTPYLYPISLALISLGVFALERLRPARPLQRVLRPAWLSDLAYLIFNGHYLGVLLAGLSVRWLRPLRRAVGQALELNLPVHLAQGLPLWLQIPLALLLIDLMQYGVHNLLHRVPWLFEFHKAHHSVRDGEMDFMVAFRFSILEVVVYRTLQYLPLTLLGFSGEALMVHAVFGTLIGHLNHANVDIPYGPLRYVLNHPQMHLLHHERHSDATTTVNYGVIFSCWDFLFGTAYLSDEREARLGFVGDETYPRDALAQQLWPLQRWLPMRLRPSAVSLLGLLALVIAFALT